jgi:hypothetical protein
MPGIDNKRNKIIELKAELGYLQAKQEELAKELNIPFTPMKIKASLRRYSILLLKLEKPILQFIKRHKHLERKERQLKYEYTKNR